MVSTDSVRLWAADQGPSPLNSVFCQHCHASQIFVVLLRCVVESHVGTHRITLSLSNWAALRQGEAKRRKWQAGQRDEEGKKWERRGNRKDGKWRGAERPGPERIPYFWTKCSQPYGGSTFTSPLLLSSHCNTAPSYQCTNSKLSWDK